MSVHLFTVGFESITELPADTMINTFHFEGSGADYANVADMLTDFYEDVPTGGSDSICTHISSRALTGDITIKAYDLSDPEPRPPVYTNERTLVGLTNSEALPDEVALCMSYHAAPAAGVAPARRRGRIYIGGWVQTACVNGRPTAGVRSVIARSGRDLIQASNASVSWEWQQYSPTLGVGNIVTGGWVDDSWDTQRRRGLASTARTSFTGGTP